LQQVLIADHTNINFNGQLLLSYGFVVRL